MRKAFNTLLAPLGYELQRRKKLAFTIAGMGYDVDACSVGLTPQGEQTGRAAARMIQEKERAGLKVLDLCCGVGIVGLTLWSILKDTAFCPQELHFADINIFNLNSLKRTLTKNGLGSLLGSQIHCHLSNGLGGVPAQNQFDLIVSNPPHFIVPDLQEKQLTPGRLGGFDPQWQFHKDFYEVCHQYLTASGEVWFLENSDGAEASTFLPYIRSNPHLNYLEDFSEPLLPGFFWMATQCNTTIR